MIVVTSGGAHECASAKQYLNGVHLLDADDNILLIITKPSDIEHVEGGNISVVENPEPTAQEDADAMLVDHEYRLTLLELGITE